jgi:radical SAM protein with 4Fe4S-binding SPASM domain
VHSATISIDSDKPEVHDRFRGLDGLFVRATRAVRLLSERGVRTVVGFTPTKLNWRDGPGVVALAADRGAAAANLSEYVPAGRGPLNLALAPSELQYVLHEWIRLRAEYRDVLQVIWHDCRVGMLVPEEEKRSYVGCGAGRLVARIKPDGTLTPCVFLPDGLGNLRERSFTDIWTNSTLLRQYRERAGHYSGNCAECEFLETCGGCRAVASAYSGGNSLAGDPHCWIKLVDPRALGGLAAGESLPM